LKKTLHLGSLYLSAFSSRIFTRKPKIQIPSPAPLTYAEWIFENEPTAEQLDEQRILSKEFEYQPKISIILQVFNTPISSLVELINSVTAQTYDNWELCISNGSFDNQPLSDELGEYAKTDPRIRILHLPENLGISENSNKALDMAGGEFVAVLDQGDTLAPFALYEVALLLQESPELDLIYSDHDHISTDGKTRLWPLFKPDWSPEIMLSANYISHLTILRTTLVRKAGGFDSSTDGVQDWDLFFEFSTQPTGSSIFLKFFTTGVKLKRRSLVPVTTLQSITPHRHI
jgi:glycosyltransferase involved in cell wall biosynthesis